MLYKLRVLMFFRAADPFFSLIEPTASSQISSSAHIKYIKWSIEDFNVENQCDIKISACDFNW